MKKGVFFTMDAVFALYIALLFLSTMMVLFEAQRNYSDDSLTIVRLSRDVYEVKKYNPLVTMPDFIATGSACDTKSSIGSAFVFGYDNIQNDAVWQSRSNVTTAYERVCFNE